MYHRVIPAQKASFPIQAGMYVEPETFETHIRFLKKHFKIIPISELQFIIGRKISNSKPGCVLTFDDGWCDFFEYAFQILKNYQIPATVFLPTDFIGTKKWFWTDRLITFLYQKKDRKNSAMGKPSSSNPVLNQLENLKGSREYRLEKAIQILKAYRNEEIEEILSELEIRWNLNPDPQGRTFMHWEEVREIALSGLISFGSHTASHRILTTLTDKEIQYELIRSKEKLIAEKVVDPLFISFSYPNGNFNEKIARMVNEVGYYLAVSAEGGWNHPGLNPFTLQRIAIHQDMTSTEAMFGCRIANIF
jgi:peptidoglycan/xylan/chitin deacetylase (PgdA/CDA1 family)